MHQKPSNHQSFIHKPYSFNPMNHNHRRTSQHSARIAFEFPNLYTKSPNEIWSVRKEGGIHRFKHEGFLLSRVDNKSLVAVTHVRRNDVVLLVHRASNKTATSLAAFRINSSYEPIPTADLSCWYENKKTQSCAARIENMGGPAIHFSENEFHLFLRSKHPEWLQQYIDNMLNSLRCCNPDVYIEHAPSTWLEHEIVTLSASDPLRALTDFPHRLTPDLEDFCIRRLASPSGESSGDSFNCGPKFDRLKLGATYALRNHHSALTSDALRRCAATDPQTAYRIRHLASDERRAAILLATSYGVAWYTDCHTLGADFRHEVYQSLTNFPEEWLRSNKTGMPPILQRLRRLLDIRFTGQEIASIFLNVKPASRTSLL